MQKLRLNSDGRAGGREAPRTPITNSTEVLHDQESEYMKLAWGRKDIIRSEWRKIRLREKDNLKAGHLNGRAPACGPTACRAVEAYVMVYVMVQSCAEQCHAEPFGAVSSRAEL